MSLIVELVTNVGSLRIRLHTEAAPRCCENFLKAVRSKYYYYTFFHRVEADFIAQTGDPTGTGRGGRCVIEERTDYFLEKSSKLPQRLSHNKKGIVSMVWMGPEGYGSQFFITLADGLDYLDEDQVGPRAFGRVEAEDFEVLDKISRVFVDSQSKRPLQDIWIKRTQLIEGTDPWPDPKWLHVPDRSPPPTQAFLKMRRVGADQDIDGSELRGDSAATEQIRAKRLAEEARSHALTLEILGDLPSADLSPPENVLFICRLNPVTTEEDLQLIFSRFGAILSCNIVRDRCTKESLGYGFIEFAEKSACEEAFRRMNQVLIDDRRVVVDFCQSLARIRQWRDAKQSGRQKEHRRSNMDRDRKHNDHLSDDRRHNDYRQREHQHSSEHQRRHSDRYYNSRSGRSERSHSPERRH